MASNENMKEKAKEGFSNLWKKASGFAEKTADSAKNLAEQTKQSIHDQKAKRYTPLTEKDLKAKGFRFPDIIRIEDNLANREFVTDKKAVGWLENHKDEQVFHMYLDYAGKSGLAFLPLPQKGSAFCKDKFDPSKYLDIKDIFDRAAKEKLAELMHIAYCLGAKFCEAIIMEADMQAESTGGKLKLPGLSGSANTGNTVAKKLAHKDSSRYEGHNNPQQPNLKWFAHDDIIIGFIEQRLNQGIRAKELVLAGSYSTTMTKSVACAIDDLLGLSGKTSVEARFAAEHSSELIFKVEF